MERAPSGTNNIHARYRKGLGSAGNITAGSIQQLVDSIPNLKKVTNPVPSSGGSDADSPLQIRTAAPASLRTFGRAVSAPDYAALALNFPGIAKATATWVVSDPVTAQAIAHPYVQLTVATVDETPIKGTLLASNLRSFLDNHRDPNVALRFQDFSPVYIELIVEIEIDSHFPQNATLSRVQAALNPGKIRMARWDTLPSRIYSSASQSFSARSMRLCRIFPASRTRRLPACEG